MMRCDDEGEREAADRRGHAERHAACRWGPWGDQHAEPESGGNHGEGQRDASRVKSARWPEERAVLAVA